MSDRELKVGDWVLYIYGNKTLYKIITRVREFTPKMVKIGVCRGAVSPRSLLIINELPIELEECRYL